MDSLIACCSLVTFKVLNSIVLLGLACSYIHDNKQKEVAAAATSNVSAATTQMKAPPVDSFSDGINFKRIDLAIKNLHRSHSVAGAMNMPPLESTLALPGQCITPCLTPKSMLSNSTVSLQSVGLNEDYVKDVAVMSPTSKGSELKQRRPQATPTQPLSEIDRYTMCSNRII